MCSLAVFHLDKARKWRNNVSFLLNSRKTGSPPWLVLSRAIRSNVERCGRFSFRSLICFRTGKKKKKRRKGWHLAGTCYAHSSPLPASSHLPPLTRNLSCILFYCTISKLIYHPLNKFYFIVTSFQTTISLFHNSTSLLSQQIIQRTITNTKQFNSLFLSFLNSVQFHFSIFQYYQSIMWTLEITKFILPLDINLAPSLHRYNFSRSHWNITYTRQRNDHQPR